MSESIKTEVSFRIDAEFYNKGSLRIYSHLVELNHKKLNEVTNKIDVGFVGAMTSHYTEDENDPILLQTKDIGEFIVDINDVIHIDSLFHKELRKSQIKKENILIARSGSFGKASIWLENYTVNSSDIIIVECSEAINPYYIVAFLNSKYGKAQLYRFASGGLQGHVNLTILENLIVPIVSNKLQREVQHIVEDAFNQYRTSKELFIKSENLLIEELCFDKWEQNTENVSVKSLKDSFCSCGRLDAEYYQVKYDYLEDIIKTVPYKTIAEIQQFNARGVQPDYVEGGCIPVVNSKHILEDGLDYDNFERTSEAFFSSQKRAQIVFGDILFYTTGANIGRTQVYLKNNRALASNHVNILRVKGVNPVYLALVLNSPIGRMQTEKLCTGSAQAEIYPSDIEKFIVPVIDETTQESIAANVQESFALRHESKRLLDIAKRAVEIAIGENEKTALDYIKEEYK